MGRQSPGATIAPEQGPGGPDVDAELRAVFVECADSLPGGRKQLGLHAYRVTKSQQGSYTPRPSDLLRVAQTDPIRARLALFLAQLADAVLDTEASPDTAGYPGVATLARETGEAVAAAAEYAGSATADTERVALRELSEAVAVLTLYGRRVGAARLARASRRTARGRMEVLS